MLWRKFKLDWSYAIGELTIVTVGVLIALAVDQWNTDRLARAEESAYMSRIIGDLNRDIGSLGFRLQALEEKANSLRRVSDQLDSGLIQDEPQFLQDAVIGANYGWNQGRANRATYDDLLGSGKFGIIGDQEVRLLIADYYQQFELPTTTKNMRKVIDGLRNVKPNILARHTNLFRARQRLERTVLYGKEMCSPICRRSRSTKLFNP